jgi:hypothetical protein
MIQDNTHHWIQGLGIALGAISTVAVAYFGFKGKKNKEQHDDCTEALKLLETRVVALRDSLAQERKLRGIVEGNWEGMKLAFQVAFDEYDERFKDHPENMGMLKTLRKIIEK